MTNSIQSVPRAETAARPEDTPDAIDLRLQVGPMVHGGHCVAQHQGRVVFIRHAIPGETVVARLTEAGPAAGLYWADTVQVLRASEFRRSHPWKLADSLRAYQAGRRPVAGAEYGHIVLEHQRRLKAQVFRDTLVRIGRQHSDDVQVQVTGLPADESAGMHWRTRTVFTVTPAGRVSMPAHRSPETVPVRNIPLAMPACGELHLWDLDFSGAERVDVTTIAHGPQVLISILPTPQVAGSPRTLQARLEGWRRQLARLPDHVAARVTVPPQMPGRPLEVISLRGDTAIQEQVSSELFGTRTFRVSGAGTWPFHRDAPVTLVEAVMTAAEAQPGQVVADLYAGAGLFSAFLADAVGDQGTVLSVEPAARTSQDARCNLDDLPQAVTLNGTIESMVAGWLHTPQSDLTDGGLAGRTVDTVVLSPPHTGAGRTTLHRIHQLDPARIVYVSSNPASLARDTHQLSRHGWQLDGIDVYDLSPNTHHMASVSVFTTH